MTVNPDGSCNTYYYADNYDYFYDEYGNRLTEKYCNVSGGFNEDGSCKTYSSVIPNEYPDEYYACSDRKGTKCNSCIGGYYLKNNACVNSEKGCGAGYAEYNNKCWEELPFSKKQWTPAEAAQWLKDTDNTVIMTFKVNR